MLPRGVQLVLCRCGSFIKRSNAMIAYNKYVGSQYINLYYICTTYILHIFIYILSQHSVVLILLTLPPRSHSASACCIIALSSLRLLLASNFGSLIGFASSQSIQFSFFPNLTYRKFAFCFSYYM